MFIGHEREQSGRVAVDDSKCQTCLMGLPCISGQNAPFSETDDRSKQRAYQESRVRAESDGGNEDMFSSEGPV